MSNKKIKSENMNIVIIPNIYVILALKPGNAYKAHVIQTSTVYNIIKKC